MICNAAAFAAEALTAWLYMEYLFKAKRSPMCLASTFLTGYAVMFLVFLLGNTTANIVNNSVCNSSLGPLFTKIFANFFFESFCCSP